MGEKGNMTATDGDQLSARRTARFLTKLLSGDRAATGAGEKALGLATGTDATGGIGGIGDKTLGPGAGEKATAGIVHEPLGSAASDAKGPGPAAEKAAADPVSALGSTPRAGAPVDDVPPSPRDPRRP